MLRELHLLACGNTRSAGPWRYPGVDNSTSGVRRRLIERARDAEAGTGAAADGFVQADSGIPGQFALFVEQVVPQLRKRELFRHEYRGSTLRGHLGPAVPTRVGGLG